MPWNLSYTVQDQGGGISTAAFKIVQDEDITFEHVILAANALGQLIDDACAGVITAVNVNFSMAPGWTEDTEALAGSDVEEGALFNWNVAGTTYTHSFRIPAYLETEFAGKVVAVEGTATAPLIAGILAGFTVDPGSDEQTVLIGDNYDNAYSSLRRAYKSFRK